VAANPSFASTPRLGMGVVSVANANRDGTGTIVSVLTGVAAGTKVEELAVEATTTVASGLLRVFLSSDGGATWRLWDEILTAAIAVSGTVAGFRTSRRYLNLVLPNANWQLGVSVVNAGESWNVFALGADL
jgi:hypothetical protein